MTDHFHAVMLDETGCEFGVGVTAATRDEAYDQLREGYPESRCVQLETADDAAERERRMYAEIDREYYGEFCDEVDWEG